MPGSLNVDAMIAAYDAGHSIPQVAEEFGVSRSTARRYLFEAGVLRSRSEGIQIAAESGRLGSGNRGKKRKFTADHCDKISRGRAKWAEKNAAGVSVKPNGYAEYTRGPNKHRSVHVVKMEKRLGRRLLADEHVHHIDGDKLNNASNNLALVTASGHARLHRFEESLTGVSRERKENGRFS